MKKIQALMLKFSKIIIVYVLVYAAAFTAACTVIYAIKGDEPVTLITAVFAFLGSEAGLLAWIKNTDTKQKRESEDSTNADG